MNVTGYRLKADFGFIELWLPAFPPGLVTDAGIVWRERVQSSKQVNFPVSIEIPQDAWLGIEKDGSATILSGPEVLEWKIDRAWRTLKEAQELTRSDSPRTDRSLSAANAVKSVSALHAAAALVGMRIFELNDALQRSKKSPGEPLETTVRTLIEELQKGK